MEYGFTDAGGGWRGMFAEYAPPRGEDAQGKDALAWCGLRCFDGEHNAGKFLLYTRAGEGGHGGVVVTHRLIQAAAYKAWHENLPYAMRMENAVRRLQYVSVVSEFIPEGYRITGSGTMEKCALACVPKIMGIEQMYAMLLARGHVRGTNRELAGRFRCSDGWFNMTWQTVHDAWAGRGEADAAYIFAAPYILGVLFKAAAMEGFAGLPARQLAGGILRRCWVEGRELWQGAWRNAFNGGRKAMWSKNQ